MMKIPMRIARDWELRAGRSRGRRWGKLPCAPRHLGTSPWLRNVKCAPKCTILKRKIQNNYFIASGSLFSLMFPNRPITKINKH